MFSPGSTTLECNLGVNLCFTARRLFTRGSHHSGFLKQRWPQMKQFRHIQSPAATSFNESSFSVFFFARHLVTPLRKYLKYTGLLIFKSRCPFGLQELKMSRQKRLCLPDKRRGMTLQLSVWIHISIAGSQPGTQALYTARVRSHHDEMSQVFQGFVRLR